MMSEFLTWLTGSGEPAGEGSSGGIRPQSDRQGDERPTHQEPPFRPKVIDVLIVKAMLSKGLHLPPELADMIVERAGYWVYSCSEVDWTRFPLGKRAQAWGSSAHADKFLVRSLPIGWPKCPHANFKEYSVFAVPPKSIEKESEPGTLEQLLGMPEALLKSPCRKIVFTIQSHDQGWGGDPTHHGTHRGSWTWFSAGLERLDVTENGRGPDVPLSCLRTIWPPLAAKESDASPPNLWYDPGVPPDEYHKIQNNVVADRISREYVVEWSHTDNITPDSEEAQELEEQGRGKATGSGEFVRNLRLGDIVTIWAHARFPQWVNSVDKVRIEMFWAV